METQEIMNKLEKDQGRVTLLDATGARIQTELGWEMEEDNTNEIGYELLFRDGEYELHQVLPNNDTVRILARHQFGDSIPDQIEGVQELLDNFATSFDLEWVGNGKFVKLSHYLDGLEKPNL